MYLACVSVCLCVIKLCNSWHSYLHFTFPRRRGMPGNGERTVEMLGNVPYKSVQMSETGTCRSRWVYGICSTSVLWLEI